MSRNELVPSPRRRRRPILLLALVAVAAVVAVLVHRSPALPSSLAGPPAGSSSDVVSSAASPSRAPDAVSPPAPPTREGRAAHLGTADGDVPDVATVFDGEYPAVANLDPALVRALRRATTDAADDGVEIHLTSGWRSGRYQAQLFRDAVAEHGSTREAARWVAPPGTSAHESGDAGDIGPADAVAWLSEHGAAYGLCPVYANEPWHVELRPEALDDGCPGMYADPTFDPRLHLQ